MIADRSVMTVIAPSHSRCSACLGICRNNPHVNRLLIGQYYDHAANMNSESAKELLKLRNSALVCRWQDERYVFWLLLGGDLT